MSHFPAQSAPSTVQLPRTLQRPPYAEVPRQNVATVAPELADVPLEYVRRGLRVKANQMLAGIAALSPSHLPSSIPRSQLQNTRTLTIPLRPSQQSPSYPTHILALSKSSSQDGSANLIATHSLVLASQCASLPRLPHSASAQPNASGLTLPVLPLSVPSPAAFAPLHKYLYTHSAATFLSTLVPAIPQSFVSTLTSPQAVRGTLASGPALHTLSAHLLSQTPRQNSMGALTGVAQNIAAVWRNAVALGVHDPELWDCLDLAWEIVLGAMNLGAGAH
ncbi:hypothetical protein BJ138DRAFT_996883 [Hygrophoropsis aurantiaca]|uniref:Uncharacterized protein n=1 Tax=Hygrophoropsis aurantiaca TaxID=72124 RepID=A0ACB8AQZ3_9AGAM|nr:hypothetical protein BJ138DRAFT_996883 [Hygrophoropsis aurantiaca]